MILEGCNQLASTDSEHSAIALLNIDQDDVRFGESVAIRNFTPTGDANEIGANFVAEDLYIPYDFVGFSTRPGEITDMVADTDGVSGVGTITYGTANNNRSLTGVRVQATQNGQGLLFSIVASEALGRWFELEVDYLLTSGEMRVNVTSGDSVELTNIGLRTARIHGFFPADNSNTRLSIVANGGAAEFTIFRVRCVIGGHA